MSARFFVSEPITTERVTLDGPEAHHLLHVMRTGPGTHITLFDDSGAEFSGVVESVRRADAVVRIIERREVNRELPYSLIAGVALPKGDRQKWLVEKLTELGVTALVPLVTERGVAQPTASAAERLVRAVIEAAKQCGRNRLMQFCEPLKWSEWIMLENIASDCLGSSRPSIGDGALAPRETWRRLFAHPGGKTVVEVVAHQMSPTAVAIGPEGGLTDAEVAAALATGWQQVSLGPRILRVETAAVALAATVALR